MRSVAFTGATGDSTEPAELARPATNAPTRIVTEARL
jgi:hypothetical protein